MKKFKKLLLLSALLISSFCAKGTDNNKNGSEGVLTAVVRSLASSAALTAGPLVVQSLFGWCGELWRVQIKPQDVVAPTKPQDAVTCHNQRVFASRAKDKKVNVPVDQQRRLFLADVHQSRLFPHDECAQKFQAAKAAKEAVAGVNTWKCYIFAKAAELMPRK